MCTSVCLFGYGHMSEAPVQVRGTGSLDLELQAIVSFLTCKPNLDPLQEQYRLSSTVLFLQAKFLSLY